MCHQKTYSQIRYLLFLLIFFIDIIGFITFLNLIQIPSGEGNFLFGYTLSRLGILAIISIGSVLVSIGIIWLQRKPNQESLERIISAINCQYTVIILFIICTLLVALIWVIGMAPDYFLGKYNLLLDRLLPLLIWISSIFVSLLILIGYYRNLSQNSGVQFIKKHLLQF